MPWHDERGAINHALRVTFKNYTQLGSTAGVWPATSFAVNCDGAHPNCIPYGARLRLKSSHVYAGSNADAAILYDQMHKYGMLALDGSTIPYEVNVNQDEPMTASQIEALAIINADMTLTSDIEFVEMASLDPYPGTDHTQADAGLVKPANGYVTPDGFAQVVVTDGASQTAKIQIIL